MCQMKNRLKLYTHGVCYRHMNHAVEIKAYTRRTSYTWTT